jgi:4-hydroxy-tetrahydrodipicolinate synthase
MIDYYISQGITGIIPMGTTGESPALSDYEKELLLNTTLEHVNGRIPIFFGHGGNYTKKSIQELKGIEASGIDGILSVCPYYNRPSQDGIYEHFAALANSTDLDILLYNVPYRTGRNIENETVYKLAEIDNIIGIKDACGDFAQTTDLLMNKPAGFSVLSGEDYSFFSSLALGADGGVVASAHFYTHQYISMYQAFVDGDIINAKKIWNDLYPIIPYLFKEPNPAPIKYLLNLLDIIETDELRLPMTKISESLKLTLNAFKVSYSLR